MDVSVTFMAKFAADRAGSSCHVHLSLWAGNRNAFAGEERLGPVRCSDVFRWFLGGWIAHAPEVMVFYAPTVNSYKRFVDASWAPTRLAWSHDNRTAGFRVVGRRREPAHRVPHPGRRLQPVSRVRGGARVRARRHPQRAPSRRRASRATSTRRAICRACRTRCSEAVDRFAASELRPDGIRRRRRRALRHFFNTEQAAYDSAVTDWERTAVLRKDLRRP